MSHFRLKSKHVLVNIERSTKTYASQTLEQSREGKIPFIKEMTT